MPRLPSTPAGSELHRVLLVDDCAEDRALAVFLLRAHLPELAVTEAADAAAFAEAVAGGEFDLVLMEHRVAWSDDLAVLELLRRLHPERPVVLWSAETAPELLSRALALGLSGYVPKTSSGYLRLPELVADLLERPAHEGPQPATEPGAPPEARGPRRVPHRAAAPDVDLFAHAASHDLQEPVQHVVRLAHRLGHRLAEGSDEETRRELEHLVASGERLQAMLDGLLEWSRLTSREHPFSVVELGAVVDEAMENLRGPIDSTGGEVTHGPLPTVVAYRAQMVQLFQNLLGNALKFHGERPPKVHVSAREEKGRWVVSVRDEGIGIDPKDHERIFGMFQRLHPGSRFPGRGIGLALCRRIVEHHGGSLRVASRPGEGATFSVVLPWQAAEAAGPRSLDAGGA